MKKMKKIIIYTILITITLIVLLGCERKIEYDNLEPLLTKDELLKKSPGFLTEEQQNLYLMLFRTNKIVKKHKMTNGILRCEISEIIMESTCPETRNRKKNKMGSTIVIITI